MKKKDLVVFHERYIYIHLVYQYSIQFNFIKFNKLLFCKELHGS